MTPVPTSTKPLPSSAEVAPDVPMKPSSNGNLRADDANGKINGFSKKMENGNSKPVKVKYPLYDRLEYPYVKVGL